MMTYRQLYNLARQRLNAEGLEDADFDAARLFEKATGLDRLGLISRGGEQAGEGELALLDSYIRRRLSREPLQYITGVQSFYGIDFAVGEGVLIPRDDTEVALELCLDYLRRLKAKPRVLDLCSGSGAIAVTLAEKTKSEVTAVELCDKAYTYLLKNIKARGSKAVAYKGDIFECFTQFSDGEFDLIVSNPPYIATDELSTLQQEVQKEPTSALDGGEDGYRFYRAIVKYWSSKLKDGGALVLELGEGQYETVKGLLLDCGYKDIKYALDLGGVKRAVIGLRNNSADRRN